MQAQQEVQLAGAARNSPLQVPLTVEEPQATQASSNPASHGNANGLMQEAAEAVQQVPHVKMPLSTHTRTLLQSHIFVRVSTKAILGV